MLKEKKISFINFLPAERINKTNVLRTNNFRCLDIFFFFQGEVSEKQRRVCHGSDGRCHGGRQMHAESELCDPVWKQNHSWVILSFNIS